MLVSKLAKLWGLLLVAFTLLSACKSTPHEVMPNDPFYAPIIAEIPEQKIAQDGSIFQADMANSLYSDVKARRVGDIITVNLQERTQATKSAGTSTNKDTSVDVNPIIGLGGNALNIGNESIQLGLGATNAFSGDASTNQSNNLVGNISVTVVQVLPNQNLLVRGEKWLTLNNGDEYIRLTGVVRPADVSPSNEIVSTKIANARIQYSGTGTFASAQKEGWLSSFFSSEYWPF
ncbi:flagellar basal body L-ring protein FlgH [Paraglaciecola hydrolytica]|uniref:Flagellar L-ring protein n=1 Tax=Paraglaciecola hydrolytica TaxID=1799789 RepID=A0A148KP16_9ALTE|nr:flagellar basal body L-ring protein FlgH [Paraglaciecola hydrolytica]KXI28021.1 flagellar biosynthesis protein FlgH [Paraglaciecola hydrolytica]